MWINLAFSTTGLVISFIFFFSNQFLNWSSKLKKFSILTRKIAGILRIEKNKFLKIMLLLLKLFYIVIFSTLMFFIIVKKDLFTKKFYLFSQDNYFFISFFALCPVISISLFLFSRLFDKNFRYSAFNRSTIKHKWKKNEIYSYNIEIFDTIFDYFIWAFLFPGILLIINSSVRPYLFIFFGNIFLSLSHFNNYFFDKKYKEYTLIKNDEKKSKLFLIFVLNFLNVFGINMLISNFQINLILLISIVFLTKYLTKFVFSSQYAIFKKTLFF
ncbi:unnamed protein product [Mycoplasma amphoriforme A39]|uniref:Uncharacterized protein n=1 Tax=Mycoplasma amphoriforme A39 TaxID=572419 RepID=A0A292IHW0_9MOLU|nr:unnamed protein product [Mycoplasma amphoriforme A39]